MAIVNRGFESPIRKLMQFHGFHKIAFRIEAYQHFTKALGSRGKRDVASERERESWFLTRHRRTSSCLTSFPVSPNLCLGTIGLAINFKDVLGDIMKVRNWTDILHNWTKPLAQMGGSRWRFSFVNLVHRHRRHLLVRPYPKTWVLHASREQKCSLFFSLTMVRYREICDIVKQRVVYQVRWIPHIAQPATDTG